MIRKLLDSLAGKLILAVSALMTIGSIIFGYIFIRYEEDVMVRNLIHYASTTADLVKRGIHFGMLAAHREVIEQTAKFFSEGSGIREISIFDKKGAIVYSSKKESVGSSVDKNYVTCRMCHSRDGKPLDVIPDSKNWVITPDVSGTKTLKFIVPLYNETSCSSASCHYHPEHKKILGLLETSLSTATVDATIRQNRLATLTFGALFLMTISLCLFYILYKFVSKPISLLNEGMGKLAKGEESVITIRSSDEMGQLARAFNSMAGDIREYQENMKRWTRALEKELHDRTEEMIKAQEQLINAEINAEKLASLGRMAAGVAHELNSPLTGIVTFAHLLLKRMPPDKRQDIEDLEVIVEQADRCSKIIKGLLGFSRKTTAEKAVVNINQLVESTISMVGNQARFHNIRFNLKFDNSLPPIAVDPNQMQQVFLNLLINAADALNERGEVTVATRVIAETPAGKSFVEIEFTDTGPGIPEEYLGKIFEPFFTTKPVGQGTGLGLAVTYGIIKKHDGNIIAKSEAGKGASFFIRLPLGERTGT